MAGQMKRLQHISIANALSDAIEASRDAMQAMLDAYIIANRNFSASENDVDPITIAMGLQAQALGIRTLAQWLDAIAEVTTGRYALQGKESVAWVEREMTKIGIVIPDTLVM